MLFKCRFSKKASKIRGFKGGITTIKSKQLLDFNSDNSKGTDKKQRSKSYIQMIEISYTKKRTPFVWASDLHKKLNIKTPLRIWFPRMIEYGFTVNEDYFGVDKNVRAEKGGMQVKKDWAVHIEMTKHIAMIQRTSRGKALRDYLINLDNKVQKGTLLNHQQILALFDLCRVLGLFSIQKYVESEHHKVFDSKNENWWTYRARVFGQSVADLKAIMQEMGKRYKNQRQALINIDKYELIRRAAFDLFKAMGKSETYAQNVSLFVKEIAKEIEPEIYDDRNTSLNFKTSYQQQIIRKIENTFNKEGISFYNQLEMSDLQL